MEKMLLNKSMVRKNRLLKAAAKASAKKFGKGPRSVIKGKLGKVIACSETACLEERHWDTISVNFDELLVKLEASGITGKSGSGFPVAGKIKTFVNSTVPEKLIIINGAECELGLVHDQWLIDTKFEKILAGIRSLSKALPATEIIFGAKLFPEHIAADRKNVDFDTVDEKICFKKLPARYPMGEEHVLINQLAGISVTKNEIPAEKGILVMNVQTVVSIYDLLCGKNQDGHFVTLADLDKGVGIPTFVKNGESIKGKLISTFGERNEYWAGAGIMGAKDVHDDAFDDKISFACVAEKTAENTNSNRCRGCGACSRNCPAKVQIKKIVALREKDPEADISGLGAERCLHCRTCSFVCAARKDVMTYIL